MKLLHTMILSLALAFGAGAVLAQDLNKGAAAYLAGDYVTAVQEWRQLAKQGLSQAQYNLGLMYNEGKGVIQDYAESVKWFRLAAEQGHANAQFNLGNMYREGKGVLQDDAEV
jgi:TPR repeat protein